jgi:hypothetical protein
MINFFVETKTEYTTQLVNILTPLIFEGIQSIYTESLKVSNEANNVLKVFQSFLKRIPKWNPDMIKQESDRIMNNSKSFSWLSDLVKATVKSNIVVLTFNPNGKSTNKIDPKSYQDIKIEDFIHKIYIECARELWNNPYLMYHQYPAIELKRNQRDTINLIKESIREAIRKLLPVKQILEIYLGEQLEPDVPNDQFDRNITEVDEINIQKMLKKDFPNNQTNTQNPQSNPQSNPQVGGSVATNQSGGDLNAKILEIIRESETKSDVDTPLTKATKDSTETSDTSEQEKNKEQEKKKKYEHIDDKIKNILEKDLGEDDIDTSLSYHPEKNDKDYQEIFSNNKIGGGDNSTVNNNTNNTNKDSSKNKRKFFNNYLNF